MKKYRVELCYTLYATPFEVEATDERDAMEKAVLAVNQIKVFDPHLDLDLSSLARWRDADMVEEVKEPERNCEQCGKDMNPLEWILGPVCGKCCKDNQRATTG